MSLSREAWVASLARKVLALPAPVLIAAHSLGCIATARLPAEAADRIACCSRCSNPRARFMHKRCAQAQKLAQSVHLKPRRD